MFLSHP